MSDNISSFTGVNPGGVGQSLVDLFLILTQSGSFFAPADGYVDIFAGAAAGSGGAILGNSTGGNATGGGAGQLGKKMRIPVVAGQEFVVTLGAPGAGVAGTTAGVAGNNAANTTISTTGWTGTLEGGKGGATRKNNSATPLLGGLGGSTGTGWDISMPGSRAGNSMPSASGANTQATGGGAPNPFALPVDTGRGGDVTAVGTAFTGGGGVGGRGGDTNASAVVNTGAGAAGGGQADNINPSAGTTAPNIIGQRADAANTNGYASPILLAASISAWGLDYFGGAGYGGTSMSQGGAGTRGGNVQAAGVFGATGGLGQTGLSPGLCAGSGGVTQAGSTASSSLAGGQAFAAFIFRRA